MRNSAQQEGERWLLQAKEDLRWAKHLSEEGGYHLACFLSQQVTEKALKAFLYAQGEEIVMGHSVANLCESAARYQQEFTAKKTRWKILDSYYIPTRYPNGLPGGIPADVFNKEAANGAVILADEAVSYVSLLLNK